MHHLLKKIVAGIAPLFPLAVLRRNPSFPPILPFYHVVSSIPLPYINSYKVRTPEVFEAELDYLLQHFEPVTLDELLEHPGNGKMHLSFDDGLKECYTIIAPILKRKGIPATFFISPDFVDNRAMFHRFKRAILESKGVLLKGERVFTHDMNNELDELAAANGIDFTQYKPYMTMQQLKSLQNDGFLIGAHSLNHPEMWLLSEEEQYRQVAQSMQWVVDNFVPKIKAFSFPFTDDGVEMSVFKRLQSEGVVDVTFGTAGLKYDTLHHHYQRIPVEIANNRSIKKTIHFEFLYYHLRELWSKNIVER
ncbi:MAG: polysaccharide deacetylase family protein [Prolixibacteraceae bacterium]|nr:polysaccharide deacetylase family protein [Prolixibacteraceae bacterium]MBN2649506.1 polysaccharide deacetylase family protein [Prolixibacteraceae bacterium]